MSSIVNPANAITAARFLTIPPYLYCVDRGDYQWAVVLLIVCALFDVIDGKVAKLLGCTTAFGEVFDAVADAICYGVFFLTLAWYGWVPRIAVGIIVGAGAVNTLLRVLYARRAGRAINYRSWAMERVVGYGTYLIGAGLCRYQETFYAYALAAVMALVVAHDAKRMLLDPIEPVDPIGPTGPADDAEPNAPVTAS